MVCALAASGQHQGPVTPELGVTLVEARKNSQSVLYNCKTKKVCLRTKVGEVPSSENAWPCATLSRYTYKGFGSKNAADLPRNSKEVLEEDQPSGCTILQEADRITLSTDLWVNISHAHYTFRSQFYQNNRW